MLHSRRQTELLHGSPTADIFQAILYLANDVLLGLWAVTISKALNALEKHGRETILLWNWYYMKISMSGRFEIQRSSAICFSGFQQEPMNVNLINCNIPRLYGLPLCRRSWWRQNNTEWLRALPSLPNICTSLPVSLPHQGREEISIGMWLYRYNSSVLWWSKIR